MRKREKAMSWWDSLSIVDKWALMREHKITIVQYPERYSSDLTGKEIEAIWENEVVKSKLTI